MTIIAATSLPTNADGVVDYRVPSGTFITRYAGGDDVWAEPSDHIHGRKHRDGGWELAVFDVGDCRVCEADASDLRFAYGAKQ